MIDQKELCEPVEPEYSGNNPSLEVSIVIPCLNEARTLPACLAKANAAIQHHKLQGEIIVVDNGSEDGSPLIAKLHGARVISCSQKGYGAALMAGISSASAPYIVMGDADNSYDFSEIFPFIEKLRQGFDLVMGCRFPQAGGNIRPGAMPWLHRWVGNPILSGLGRLFFQSPVTDFHCGLRAFKRETISALNLRSTGMEFASEMVIKATLHQAKITEIPITLHKDGRNRSPHLRTWRDGWHHLRFMLMYCPRWLFFIPGSALLLLGSILGARLFLGPIHIGGVTFDTNTMLISSMAILVGFNLITFAFISKIFAISTGLLPHSPKIEAWTQSIKLEQGIILGLLTVFIGLGFLVGGVLFWQNHAFGPLSYPDSLRLIIPGTTALTLGVEIIFSSFLMSILLLKRK
ncbi:MAG: glycosyltransferase family 2 protein [Nitrospirae bacterium]|nr:glycosyltransferase family 2 protein [Nitrospirota bacterium]